MTSVAKVSQSKNLDALLYYLITPVGNHLYQASFSCLVQQTSSGLSSDALGTRRTVAERSLKLVRYNLYYLLALSNEYHSNIFTIRPEPGHYQNLDTVHH